jgi:hypothetical protein
VSLRVDRKITAVYGFVADQEKTNKHNLAIQLSRQSAFLLFSRPRNLSCHNLCTRLHPPPHFQSLLGLGLNFCPKPAYTTGPQDFAKVADRFRRDIYTQMMFAGAPDIYDPKQLFIRSDWEPDSASVPIEFRARVSYFLKQTRAHFQKRRAQPNLTPLQNKLLQDLRDSKDFIVVPSDKNLGPCILERQEYIEKVLEHLSDTITYRQLSSEEAQQAIKRTDAMIENFISDHSRALGPSDEKFLTRSLEVTDPFAHFYIMAKVHKIPWTVRPIVSCSGSISHGLGRWLDQQLKPIVRKLPSYISSSFDLKQKLQRLKFTPSRVSMFTCDAVSMYTNIDTEHALEKIAVFLRTSPLCRGCLANEIIKGLRILMRNNIFQFGDTYWIQEDGTAMGTPPAPDYATLYFGIYELEIGPRFKNSLAAYFRYIDDCLGLWLHHPDPSVDLQRWNDYKFAMNTYGKLTWVFTPFSKRVDFMDLTLSITDKGIHTRIFEKKLNLYLYIPPHSAHSPGVLRGLIIGMISRIYRLTTDWQDKKIAIRDFFLRLANRGYASTALRTHFTAALLHLERPTFDEKWWEFEKRCFLHLPFRPDDPSSRVIQRLFRQHLLSPPAEPPLPELRNHLGHPLETNRLIIAYHRPNNLRNLLFPRIFQGLDDRPVSSFLPRQPAPGI